MPSDQNKALEFWLDVHLSPAIGDWIAHRFGTPCLMLRDMGLFSQRTRRSSDWHAGKASR